MKILKCLKIGFSVGLIYCSLTSWGYTLSCMDVDSELSVTLSHDHSAAQIYKGTEKIMNGELVCQKNISDIISNYYLLCSTVGAVDSGYLTHFVVFNGIVSAHISTVSTVGQRLIQSLPCE